MFAFFLLIYIIFILLIVTASFFIVTRLHEYSINPSFTKPLIIVFIVVTIILIAMNFSFFIAIPFDDIAQNNNIY